MVSHQFIDTLFCEEDHFDSSSQTLFSSEEDSCSSHQPLNLEPFLKLFEQDSLSEREELKALLYKEEGKELYEEAPSLAKPRREVVEWMLRVVAYYSFSSLTAVLAVSYLDRFLNRFPPHSDKNKPWMFQLAAVACLSLAAKVDETDVPLLLDLQVEEPSYVFEPKNIQKMEILILSTLEWKMNPVTPISFLDYIARRLAFKDHLCREFLARCEHLLLSVITDGRFMTFLPSTMATATMLLVIASIEPSLAAENHDQLLGILGINKDKVRDCCTLMQEVSRNVGSETNSKRKYGCLACSSPKGMFDLSFSSDSSNDSWAVASVSSSPEPQSKKIKTPKGFHFSEF